MDDKRYLTLKVGETHLELLSLGELPAVKVMDMLAAKDGKLEKTLELMELASRDPRSFLIEKEYMSFNELLMLIDEWMDRSSANSTYIKKQHEKGKTKKRKAPQKEEKAATELISSVMDILLPEILDELDGQKVEPSDENISYLISKSGLDINGMEMKDAIKLMAMWVVATDREELIISMGLLSPPDRAGKYYPIVGGVIKRSLGFTRAEAEERINEKS